MGPDASHGAVAEGEVVCSSWNAGWLTAWAVGERDPTVEPPLEVDFPPPLLPPPCARRGRTSTVIIAGGTKAVTAARRSRNDRRVSGEAWGMFHDAAFPEGEQGWDMAKSLVPERLSFLSRSLAPAGVPT